MLGNFLPCCVFLPQPLAGTHLVVGVLQRWCWWRTLPSAARTEEKTPIYYVFHLDKPRSILSHVCTLHFSFCCRAALFFVFLSTSLCSFPPQKVFISFRNAERLETATDFFPQFNLSFVVLLCWSSVCRPAEKDNTPPIPNSWPQLADSHLKSQLHRLNHLFGSRVQRDCKPLGLSVPLWVKLPSLAHNAGKILRARPQTFDSTVP